MPRISKDRALQLGYAVSARLLEYSAQLTLVIVLPLALGPLEYTDFQLVLPAVFLLSSFSLGWLNGAVFRFVHEVLGTDSHENLRTIIFFHALVYLALALVGFFVWVTKSGWYGLICALIVTTSLRDLVIKTLIAKESYLVLLLSMVAHFVGKVGFLSFIFVSQTTSMASILLVYALSDLAATIPVMRLTTYGVLGRTLNKELLGRYFRYGFPLILNTVGTWIISLSDRYILSIFNTKQEVAGYILSYQISSSAVSVPLMLFVTVYFPFLIRVDRDRGSIFALLVNRRYAAWYAVFGLLLAGFAFPIFSRVLPEVYRDYEISSVVIGVVLVAQFVSGLAHFYNKEFELNGKTIVITKSVAIGALCNLGMNFVLVPFFGANGAAVSTLIGYSTMVVVVAGHSTSLPKLRSGL